MRSTRSFLLWCRRRSTWARLWLSFSRRTRMPHMKICLTKLRWAFWNVEALYVSYPIRSSADVYPCLLDYCSTCWAQLQPLHWGHAAAPCPVCGGAGGELWWGWRLRWAAHHCHSLYARLDQAGWCYFGKEVSLVDWRSFGCFSSCVSITDLPKTCEIF